MSPRYQRQMTYLPRSWEQSQFSLSLALVIPLPPSWRTPHSNRPSLISSSLSLRDGLSGPEVGILRFYSSSSKDGKCQERRLYAGGWHDVLGAEADSGERCDSWLRGLVQTVRLDAPRYGRARHCARDFLCPWSFLSICYMQQDHCMSYD